MVKSQGHKDEVKMSKVTMSRSKFKGQGQRSQSQRSQRSRSKVKIYRSNATKVNVMVKGQKYTKVKGHKGQNVKVNTVLSVTFSKWNSGLISLSSPIE